MAVYSLRNHLWTIKIIPMNADAWTSLKAPFSRNKYVYCGWIVYRFPECDTGIICSFDFNTEEFNNVAVLEPLKECMSLVLFSIGELLAVISSSCIWVMKKYDGGNTWREWCLESWIKNAFDILEEHMHSSATCTRYEEDDESICHAVIDCAESRDVWLSSPFCSIINDAPRDSFVQFFVWLHSHSTKDDLSLICATLWSCWTGRNMKVMENAPCDVDLKLVTDYMAYTLKLISAHRPSIQVFDSWQPPSEGFIKINFDASVGIGRQRDLGIVFRNEHGEILMTGTKRMQANWNVELSEASAALYGLEVARRLSFKNIHMEGDAINVLHAIRKQQQGLAPINLILDRCCSVLSFFDSTMFSFVRRVDNTVVHMVARCDADLNSERLCMPLFLSVLGYLWSLI